MSTEPEKRLDLDAMVGDDALLAKVATFEEEKTPLVFLTASVESLGRIRTSLLALRAGSISGLVNLTPPSLPLTDDEIKVVLAFLRDWDQLTLANFLGLLGERLPEAFRGVLQMEAKIESKWFQEWLVAASDSRIHRYPGLPWRSFIRKIVRENYKFSVAFLDGLVAGDAPAVQALLKAFLEEKKKVVCIFPKRWGGKA